MATYEEREHSLISDSTLQNFLGPSLGMAWLKVILSGVHLKLLAIPLVALGLNAVTQNTIGVSFSFSKALLIVSACGLGLVVAHATIRVLYLRILFSIQWERRVFSTVFILKDFDFPAQIFPGGMMVASSSVSSHGSPRNNFCNAAWDLVEEKGSGFGEKARDELIRILGASNAIQDYDPMVSAFEAAVLFKAMQLRWVEWKISDDAQ